MAATFKVTWDEDSNARVLARLSHPDGTGEATGKDGEGKWLKQADISTITCKVFDVEVSTSSAAATPTVTVSSAVLDTPVTTAVDWTEDDIGYNFKHDLASTNFPTGGNTYRVEYKVTLAAGLGSGIFHGRFEGQAVGVYGS